MSNLVFADIASSAKITIDHPTEIVWPHLMNQELWMKDFVVERISGERNKEGEVKKISAINTNPDGVPVSEFQPFYFKTLLLVPLRRFVYKAYTEHRTGDYGFTGVEILTLGDFGSSSVVTFEAYIEMQSGKMTTSELVKLIAMAKESGAALWERNFQRLNALVNSAGRA